MAVPKTRGALLLGLWASLTLWQSAQGEESTTTTTTSTEWHFLYTANKNKGRDPKECTLIIETKMYNDVLIYNGTWFNGRPAFISVNEDGSLGDRTLYYSKLDKWNYAYVGKDDNADPYDRLAYVDPGWDRRCPQEDQTVRYLSPWSDRKKYVGSWIGTIHRAQWPSFDMCRRKPGAIYGYTDRKLVGGAHDLTACGRKVLIAEPEADGAQWNDDGPCHAVFGKALEIRVDKVVAFGDLPTIPHPLGGGARKRVFDADNYRFSCIFRAYPKPGSPIGSDFQLDFGEVSNRQACLQKAAPERKRVKAVVYNPAAKQCVAKLDGRGTVHFSREYNLEVFHTSPAALSRKPLKV